MPSRFEIGEQPCAAFRPKGADIPHARGLANEHECFGPWAMTGARIGGCAGTVSFCLNCHTDHHAGGYESCPHPPKEQDDA
jgi:hypothetical protein